VEFDFAGSLGVGLIVAGFVIKLLGRSSGRYDVKAAADRFAIVVAMAGVALTAVSIYLAGPR
jgi:hypothetical protein